MTVSMTNEANMRNNAGNCQSNIGHAPVSPGNTGIHKA